jgi:hypothetical protein
MPYFIKALVEFERWDHNEQKNRNIIVRNFILILFNLTVFLVRSFGGLLRIQFNDGMDYQSVIEKNDRSNFGPINCKYDLTGEQLIILAFAEIFFLVTKESGKGMYRQCLYKKFLKKDNWQA